MTFGRIWNRRCNNYIYHNYYIYHKYHNYHNYYIYHNSIAHS